VHLVVIVAITLEPEFDTGIEDSELSQDGGYVPDFSPKIPRALSVCLAKREPVILSGLTGCGGQLPRDDLAQLRRPYCGHRPGVQVPGAALAPAPLARPRTGPCGPGSNGRG
jgi:hypothetical protein